MIGTGFRNIEVLYGKISTYLFAKVSVTQWYCKVWIAWSIVSVLQRATASTMASLKWLPTFITLLNRAFATITSWCFVSKFGVYCRLCILLGTICHGCGLEFAGPAMAHVCVYNLRLYECCYGGQERISADQYLAKAFGSFADFKVPVNMIFNLVSEARPFWQIWEHALLRLT